MVEWILRAAERLVIPLPVVGDRTRKRKHGGQCERGLQIQCEQVPAHTAIAIVERKRVFEQEMRGGGRQQRGNLFGPHQGEHLGEQLIDAGLGVCAGVHDALAGADDLHVAIAEQFAVGAVVVRDLVAHHVVVDRA